MNSLGFARVHPKNVIKESIRVIAVIRSLKMHLVLAVILVTVYIAAIERKLSTTVESGFMGAPPVAQTIQAQADIDQ
jgi:hypothetical protein